MLKLGIIFAFAAVAEIAGCFLTFAVLRENKPFWLLIPAGLSLFTFAWLLSIPDGPAGRTYAAYGGIYIVAALIWIWKVEGVIPDKWDITGAVICLIGTAVIALGPRGL
ncbi:MAG: YnfA family protein [Oligoflexus sp.]|nr:YnfA family protein [Oligoflexus sp.]